MPLGNEFNPVFLNAFSKEQAWQYRVLPKLSDDNGMVLLCDDTENRVLLANELRGLLGKRIIFDPHPESIISRLLNQHYPKEEEKVAEPVEKVTLTTEGDNFLNDLVLEARALKSSDVHLEVYEEYCRVRIRIDGVMVERYALKKGEYPALINKIKLKAHLDTEETRLPQDGKINFRNASEVFDVKVSVLPTLHGEKVVLRLLNNHAANIDLKEVGFSAFDLANYLQGVKRPKGIILISGPSGCGKTTTLYSTLKYLNKETMNILTIEDPIEYTLHGINQVQLNPGIGITYTSALQTFFRQDPDVIMIGEIRDAETANMAIKAALAGHLVFSTIHSDSAWNTISHFMDMGIPAYQIANALNTSVAQRLIRILCKHCKERASFEDTLYPKQFAPFAAITHHYHAKGCEHCHYTGFNGRKAVYEVIPMDLELSHEIKQSNHNVHYLLKERGVKSLGENAFEIFARGETTIEEIYPLLFLG